MLARLAHGEATVNELAEPFDLSLPAISKHLKVLERAGLVVRGQHAQYRPRSLDPGPLEEVSSWAEQYRPVWEARLDRMDTYLQQLRTRRQGRVTTMATTRTPDRVRIERTFPAPPETIWTLWTQPGALRLLVRPRGSTVPVAEMDVRVGGTRLLCMEVQTPQGPRRMWFTGTYLEVVAEPAPRLHRRHGRRTRQRDRPRADGDAGRSPRDHRGPGGARARQWRDPNGPHPRRHPRRLTRRRRAGRWRWTSSPSS